jgi:hypothetical protein
MFRIVYQLLLVLHRKVLKEALNDSNRHVANHFKANKSSCNDGELQPSLFITVSELYH